MTTRKDAKGPAAEAVGADASASRVTRPPPARKGPKRDGSSPKPPPAGQGPGPTPRHDVKLTEAAAHAVQTGYNVIAENIEQGRKAAARFREGKYNIRDVPKDAQEMASGCSRRRANSAPRPSRPGNGY